MKFFVPTLLFGCLLISSSVQANTTLAEKLGCASCHRFSSDAPNESHKAPDLFYAGNKFQETWLKKFLQNPVTIRKAGTINDPGFLQGVPTAPPHPSLSKADALKMTEFLLSLTLPDIVTGQIDDIPLSKGKRVRTKILFERNYGCIACHKGINLAGQARGGISGPYLANAGNRLKADWVFNRLKTPEKFLSKSRMPLYKFDDETTIKLTKYMMSLKIGDWK